MYPGCTVGDHLFGSRSQWLNHEETSHRRVWRCRDHSTEPYISESDFRAHLTASHQVKDDETLEGLVEFSSTAVDDDRQYCPLCLIRTASLPQSQTLFKHIANHLETLATFAIPRNVDVADDNGEGGSNDPVQADDNDDHPWSSDVLSEWSDDAQIADTDGVKIPLDQFSKHDPAFIDKVNDYLNKAQELQHIDTGHQRIDNPDSFNLTYPTPEHRDTVYGAAIRIQRHWRQHSRRRRPQHAASSIVAGKRPATTTLPNFLRQSKAGKFKRVALAFMESS